MIALLLISALLDGTGQPQPVTHRLTITRAKDSSFTKITGNPEQINRITKAFMFESEPQWRHSAYMRTILRHYQYQSKDGSIYLYTANRDEALMKCLREN